MNTNTSAFDHQIPILIRNIENALRAGYSVKQALEIVAKDMPDPAGTEAQRTLDDINAGTDWPHAFDNWLQRVPSSDLDLIVATLRVQFEVGGNLADKLQLVGQVMAKRANSLKT